MKDLLRNRTVLGLISIVMALVICFGLTPLYNQSIQEKIDVVRLVKNVEKGQQITKEMFQTVTIGGYNLPENVLKNDDAIINQYAKSELYIGDYFVSEKIQADPLTEFTYLYDLDGTNRAISITIKSFAAGLSGKLEKGDIVSIIASEYGEFRETTIPVELQYVEVLAVTASSGADTNYILKENSDQELPTTLTLIVNQEQATLLAELESKSKIHVALVYRGDQVHSVQFLEEQQRILEEIKKATEVINEEFVEQPNNEPIQDEINQEIRGEANEE